MANVLAGLPKSANQAAKAALTEIYNAQYRADALVAVRAFEISYGAGWPKAAVAKTTKDLDTSLALTLRPPSRALDPPAHHELDESTFATVRLRARVTNARLEGRRSHDYLQGYRIGTSPTACRERPHLVALVRA